MNNNNRIFNENTNRIFSNKNYHFEPIDQDFSSNSISSETNNSNFIYRPIPISNYHTNTIIQRPQIQQQQSYVSQIKRNSVINIDSSHTNSTVQAYGLPRSMTSNQLTDNTNNNNKTTNRLYYYPSVQDVLDALNRHSFDKESFV